jgi:hypothetical protein
MTKYYEIPEYSFSKTGNNEEVIINIGTEEEVNRRIDELKKKRLESKNDDVIRLEGELKTLEAEIK